MCRRGLKACISVSSSLSTFHYGIAATSVLNEIKFDESIRLFDDAVSEGRGVVITSPHWTGHELVAAMINRRHPTTLLVRQARTPERTARKLKWYAALGVETVLRPDRASTVKDAVAYLGILKKGKAFGITLTFWRKLDKVLRPKSSDVQPGFTAAHLLSRLRRERQ
jgi:lauroyl/myristoyl acyltransferase